MRCRGKQSTPVTFFSFQDVMLCLLGVTLIVTLILALQITSAAAKSVARAGREQGGVVDANEQVRAASARVAALEVVVREAQQRPDVDPLAKRARLRHELLSSGIQLDELQKQAELLMDQLRALTLEHPESGAVIQLTELMRARDEMLAELWTLERRRRVAYIVDPTKSLVPILLEVSRARIVACDLSADGVAVRIASANPAAQVNDALQYYQAVSAGQNAYLLLIVKPSGIAQYWSIREAIDALPVNARPALGVDLIPEDAFVSELFPSAQIGGEP